MERLGDKQAARSRPEIDDLLGTSTECDDGLCLPGLEHVEELVPPVLDARGRRGGRCFRVDLPLETIGERVDHGGGLADPELAQEALCGLTGRAYEHAPGAVLLVGGVLG